MEEIRKIICEQLEQLDVDDFGSSSKEEYATNLKRLGISNYEELVGQTVGFIKPSYGIHTVDFWNPETAEYQLEAKTLDGSTHRFWTSPFKILPMKDVELYQIELEKRKEKAAEEMFKNRYGQS